ncbi:glycosyltransferase family 2 protein [Segetibacter koreensis]|uniref:glycosyltransferase family 2 protein n=1 Tax=Segetibacter koreensis TaxID=398037 RepID=UPI00036F2811|nr:glycosyltransferase [Segetibacter koreensis]
MNKLKYIKKVSVVIPVYGQWKLVKRNVDALLKYDRKNIYEIIIVNDKSPEENPYSFDDTVVKIINNDKNIGYTGTVNNGLKKAESDVVILLDSDAFPIEAFVEKLLAMYEDSNIGCIGFRTVDEDGNETGSFEQYEPSVIGLILGQQLQLKLNMIEFWRKRKILPYSCSVSFRKKCLQELDYFDAQLFPTLEADNDISLRVHQSKWKLIMTPEITLCHKGGNSYNINYKRVLMYHESRWRLLKKHSKIKAPALVKELIKTRIKVELLILAFLEIIKYKNMDIGEKIKGRKIILQKVNTFN